MAGSRGGLTCDAGYPGFAIDVKAGFLVFCFTAAYWVLMSVLMLRYRPFVLREMIAFASQYSQIQKGMLKNFSIPYAVLDTDGRSTLDE